MEQTISFDTKLLKAAAIIAPRNDIRYYLNGVLVEVFEKETRLVTTDGHRMTIFRQQVESPAPCRFIVPADIIGLLKTPPRHGKVIETKFHYDPEKPTAKVMLEHRHIGIQFAPIDGKYPDYLQTMNKAAAPSGVFSTINVSYLFDFKRILEAAFGPDRLYTPSIWHNGDGPAAVTYKERDDFFGIVMPMRAGFPFKPPPWTLPMQDPAEEPLAA